MDLKKSISNFIFPVFIVSLLFFVSCDSKKTKPGPSDPDKLDIPVNVNASSGSSFSSISLTWDTVSQATFYEIYRADSVNGTYNLLDENVTNAYADGNLDEGAVYFYKVKAGWRSSSDPAKIVFSELSGPCSGHTAMGVPQNISASNDNEVNTVVSWESNARATGYKVYRAAAQDSDYSLISEIAGGDNTSYTDDSISPGTEFFYKISAVSEDLIESAMSNFIKGYILTGHPQNLVASVNYFTKITLQWSATANTDHYVLYRNGQLLRDKILTNSFVDTGNVNAATDYSYTVKSVSPGGIASLDSNTAIGRLRGASSPVQLSVTWSRNREHAVNMSGGGYKVYYSQTNDFNIYGATFVDVPHDGGETPVQTTINVDAGGTWYIKVVAYSSLKPEGSDESDQFTITVE